MSDVLWDDTGHVTKPELRSVDGLLQIWFVPGASQQYYPMLHTAFWGRSTASGVTRRSATIWSISSFTPPRPASSPWPCSGLRLNRKIAEAPRGEGGGNLPCPGWPGCFSPCIRSAWSPWPGFPSRRTPRRACSICYVSGISCGSEEGRPKMAHPDGGVRRLSPGLAPLFPVCPFKQAP